MTSFVVRRTGTAVRTGQAAWQTASMLWLSGSKTKAHDGAPAGAKPATSSAAVTSWISIGANVAAWNARLRVTFPTLKPIWSNNAVNSWNHYAAPPIATTEKQQLQPIFA